MEHRNIGFMVNNRLCSYVPFLYIIVRIILDICRIVLSLQRIKNIRLMKNRNLHHKDHWATPEIFKNEIYEKYNINFDPCPYMHDVNLWDGLTIDWKERNYINPPYSQKLKEAFVKRAITESRKGKLCVMLLPVSTSTMLFHDYILPNKQKIEFLKKRLKFQGINSKGQYVNYPNPTDETILWNETEIPKHLKNSGMHDSMVVVFDGRKGADFRQFYNKLDFDILGIKSELIQKFMRWVISGYKDNTTISELFDIHDKSDIVDNFLSDL